jgi:small-conductance mechanosensitive channel
VAVRHTKTLQDPPPVIHFIRFGDSSLDFELVVWTAEATFSPQGYQSDLYFGMEKALRDNGIEIPFPQRDLHLRSGSLHVQPGGGGAATVSLKA